jgi:membrane-bound lytic murein transglycosylase B
MRLPLAIWPIVYKAHQLEMQFVQSRLTELGFETLGADGFSGPNTEMAVEAFQAALSLPVDGFVGLALLRRLETL